LKADAKRHAEATFTVTNVAVRPVRGMARANALDDTKQEWLSIVGESERDFGAGTTQQFTVNFDASAAQAGASAGKYRFRLVVASAINPDEDFAESPVVTVDAPAGDGPAPPPPPPRPMFWLIPVIAVLLIGIAIGAWLLLRTKNVEVPSVVGKSVEDATTILADSKLKANVGDTRVTGKVPPGLVAKQLPDAGSGSIPAGSTVELIVEAATPTPTPVPTQRINVARGKPATQINTAFAALAARAVDGNTSGNWADNSVTHTERTQNAWWQVDLRAEQPIVQIKIWNRTDCCGERLSNFFVLVSSVPFTSNDLNTTLSQPGVSGFQAPSQAGSPTVINIGKTARFVRVQLVGTDFLSLAEVEVIADVAAPVAQSADISNLRRVELAFNSGNFDIQLWALRTNDQKHKRQSPLPLGGVRGGLALLSPLPSPLPKEREITFALSSPVILSKPDESDQSDFDMA
jgi:hypothetical protein